MKKINFSAFLFVAILLLPQVSTANQVQQKLRALQTKDPVLSSASQWVREVIPKILSKSSNTHIEFYVLEYKSNQNKVDKLLYTDTCKVLTSNLRHPIILCNASMLYEIEAVCRSFELTNPYFSSDEALFGLVKKISGDPKSYLMTLRNSSYDPAMDEDMSLHMKLAMLYFVCHEIGHILQGDDDRKFASTLHADQPLETRVTEGVVRMCKHAEEFTKSGWVLDFFKDIVDVNSNIRKVERKLREKILISYKNANVWYQDEVSADDRAADLMIAYLSELDRSNPEIVRLHQHTIISNLFFVGIYSWYKDLYNFTNLACSEIGEIKNSYSLMVCMMMNRERYIQAASLFGDVHRFLLLRSYFAIEKILKNRTDFFSIEYEKRTIFPDPEELKKMNNRKLRETIWYFGELQQYALLQILMDTPFKMTCVGCATGWFKEIDKERGSPQLFMMDFEPINVAVSRLSKLK